jgi:IS4 transposase
MKLQHVGMSLAAVLVALALSTTADAGQSKTAPPKAAAADEKDETVALSAVPKVVKDTLSQYAKESEVRSVSKGDNDGTIVYEFDIEQGAKKFEVSITPKGAFFGSEEVIQLADVPEAARTTFEKRAQGGKIISVERAGGKQTEVVVDPNGKVLSTEAVTPGKG